MSKKAKQRSKAAPALIAVAAAAANGALAFSVVAPGAASSDSGPVSSDSEARPVNRAERMSFFSRGCMEGCLKNNEQSVCQGYCDCMSVEVDRRAGNAKRVANSELLAAVQVCDPRDELERR